MKFRNQTHSSNVTNVPGPGSYTQKNVMNNTCYLQGKDTRFKRNDPHKFPSAANYSPKHNGNRSPEIKFGKGQRGNQESPNKLLTPGPGTYENPDTMNKTLFSFGNKSTYQYCETTPGPDH